MCTSSFFGSIGGSASREVTGVTADMQPNTPCLVGESASAMCLGGKATDADGDVVQALFAAVGKMFRVLSPITPSFIATPLSPLKRQEC